MKSTAKSIKIYFSLLALCYLEVRALPAAPGPPPSAPRPPGPQPRPPPGREAQP
jgi:hypothetical protein